MRAAAPSAIHALVTWRAALRPDRAGRLDRPAEQQQLRYGWSCRRRVGDDGEGAPAVQFIKEGGHRRSGSCRASGVGGC